MTDHILTGFGFGPIQAGLFVPEAYNSGNFGRIVIAEIDADLVNAVRENDGCYTVNTAGSDGIYQQTVKNLEIYNPLDESDRKQLLSALSCSTEIVTSLPSVDYYEAGNESSSAGLIAGGLEKSTAPATVIYTAENNNHAAEMLSSLVQKRKPDLNSLPVQFLNTVIGKMSQVVASADEINRHGLEPVTAGIERAFLVERFNRILVTRNRLDNFRPGIEVFIEKDDLMPFEEAKLYGHNAIHAIIAYLAADRGYRLMTEVKNDREMMQIARNAFIEESGRALIRKYSRLDDELFTEAGFREYADDLLERMVNPWLSDTVERAARDPIRKLGPDDRIFGTIRLALDNGIEPVNMAAGAVAGMRYILNNRLKFDCPIDIDSVELASLEKIRSFLRWLWPTGRHDDISSIASFIISTMKLP